MLCGLGHWQQERLVWKNNLQTVMNAEFEKDASKTPLSAADLEKMTDEDIRRGVITGRLDFDHQVALRGQIVGGKSVNYALIPMILKEKPPRTVFVVATYQSGTEPIATPSTRGSADRVTGTARLPRWSRFAGENAPEKGEWYRAATAEMATSLKLPDALPALFYLESSNYKLDARPTVEVSRELRNDHKQYMFFWYTMALILAAIYVLRFWRKPSAT